MIAIKVLREEEVDKPTKKILSGEPGYSLIPNNMSAEQEEYYFKGLLNGIRVAIKILIFKK